MAGSFLFKKRVSIIGGGEDAIGQPPCVHIELVQNGFQLRYEGKEFNADSLEKALEMTKSWFEDMMKKAK